MSKDYTEADLGRQAQAARALLADLASDDEDLNHDAVEGETNFFETVQRALDRIAEDEALVEGCKVVMERIANRKRAAEARIERMKGAIDQAWQIAEIQTHRFPTCTISRKAIPPKLIITDESAIPTRFWKTPDPVLDKKALLDAVKARGEGDDPIPGASLSNGGVTIQFRSA